MYWSTVLSKISSSQKGQAYTNIDVFRSLYPDNLGNHPYFSIFSFILKCISARNEVFFILKVYKNV
jgi:hypothetical protein